MFLIKLYSLFLLLFTNITLKASEQFRLTTEEYPPYNMTEVTTKKVIGISTEIVRELFKRAHIPYTIRVYPWQRAMNLAQSKENTCVYSLSRTPEREASYKWVGPLLYNDWVLFTNAESSLNPKKLEDVKPFRIGTYIGDAIAKYLENKKYNFETTATDNSNPHKLLSGRIQFWATGKLVGQYILKQENITGVVPVLTFNRTEMYLGCNKNIDDNTILNLNKIIRAMQKEGTINQIYKKHGYTP